MRLGSEPARPLVCTSPSLATLPRRRTRRCCVSGRVGAWAMAGASSPRCELTALRAHRCEWCAAVWRGLRAYVVAFRYQDVRVGPRRSGSLAGSIPSCSRHFPQGAGEVVKVLRTSKPPHAAIHNETVFQLPVEFTGRRRTYRLCRPPAVALLLLMSQANL